MGMYDYVRFQAPCKKCGAVLTEWQTKDGECVLDTIEPDPLVISHWYTHCRNCQHWNARRVKMLTWEIVDASDP